MRFFQAIGDVVRRKSDVQEEIESHLRMAMAERVARGETPEAARRGGMVLMLMMVALAAGYLPARRASRIDPLNALRVQ